MIGAADGSARAVLVTLAGTKVIDRRRIELGEEGLPMHPHHHEGQKLPIDEAVALVERVRAGAERRAKQGLAALAGSVGDVAAIALRVRPELPPTIAERITDYRAQNCADSVMFRTALADAASARGWAVSWYDAHTVIDEASRAFANLDELYEEARRALGPPWRKDHRVAMAAALLVR